MAELGRLHGILIHMYCVSIADDVNSLCKMTGLPYTQKFSWYADMYAQSPWALHPLGHCAYISGNALLPVLQLLHLHYTCTVMLIQL